jgi:hypothetical protein
MVNVLQFLLDNGSETPESIDDTHPRDRLMQKIESDMEEKTKDAENGDYYFLDMCQNDEPLLKQIIDDGYSYLLSEITSYYLKIKKIPVTRLLSHSIATEMMTFLKYFVSKYTEKIVNHPSLSDICDIDTEIRSHQTEI